MGLRVSGTIGENSFLHGMAEFPRCGQAPAHIWTDLDFPCTRTWLPVLFFLMGLLLPAIWALYLLAPRGES